MRYYFDFTCNGVTKLDGDGVDLDNLAAVEAQVKSGMFDIAREIATTCESIDLNVLVRDSIGAHVFEACLTATMQLLVHL